MSYKFSKRKRLQKSYPRQNTKKNLKPLSKMTEQEKIALATSLIARSNAILGYVDLAWLKEKNAIDTFNSARLQLAEIARTLNSLAITQASEIKREGEKQ